MSEVINWFRSRPKEWVLYFAGGHDDDDFTAHRWRRMLSSGPLVFDIELVDQVTDALTDQMNEHHPGYAPYSWKELDATAANEGMLIGLADNDDDIWWLIQKVNPDPQEFDMGDIKRWILVNLTKE